MIMNCPNACKMCEFKKNPKLRCDRKRMGMSPDPAYQPGEMNAMFENISTHEYFKQFSPEVLSTEPYVVRFNNFVSDEEIEALRATTKDHFERSTDQGGFDEFGKQEKVVSQGRTSNNAWCNWQCERDKTVQQLYRKIEGAVGIPYGHFEAFQVLDYGVGQHYNRHHDQGQADARNPDNSAGPRILTFFLYLSDVEEGGETEFSDIGLKVKPKKGSAILWPSVTSDDLTKVDFKTHHAALPVKKGRKFAANSWIHLYDYRIPNLWGCTGSFD
jgi:hypothetical protein